MKCQQCSTDAPAETDPESGRLRCSQCHAFFGSGTTQTAAVRQARDILRKWSSADLLDQISSFPQVPPLADPASSGLPSGDASGPAPGDTSTPSDDRDADDRPRQQPPAEIPDSIEAESEILSLPDINWTADMPEDAERLPDNDPAPLMQHKDEESTARPPTDVRPLSILRPDESADVGDTPDDQPLPSEDSSPESASSSSSQNVPRDRNTRRLVRPPVVRRRPRPSAAPPVAPESSSETAQQGMDAVHRNLRIDRPAEHAPAGDLTTPAEDTAPVDPRAQDASSARRFRIDSPEDVQALADTDGRVRGQARPRQRFVDEAHESASLRGPHFHVTAQKRSSLTSLTGQFLAYIGVLGLTVGTAIVIYGHFGGMSEYTPTGWLVTTVAQMLLFLGIINLVSGGIEQNNNDVSHRINVLGEQLMRLEQVTESAMRGPRIPVERYAGTAPANDVSERESVTIDER